MEFIFITREFFRLIFKVTIIKVCFLTQQAAETPFWIIELQLDSTFSYYFGHLITLSANIHDLSANMTKIVCKC